MPPTAPARPLLILLPGMDGTGAFFEPFLEVLDPGFDTQVVRYPTALVSYPACLHFARTLLPKDRPYLLLGESFSGPIAIALAAERPEGLVGLVLVSTFARNPHPLLAWAAPLLGLVPGARLPLFLLRYMLLGPWATERLLALAVAMHAAVPPVTLTRRLRAIVGVDHTALLAQVRVPVLALCGGSDRLVPKAATDWIRAHLAALDIVTLQGPHWILQTRPDAAAQAIAAFLARSGDPALSPG